MTRIALPNVRKISRVLLAVFVWMMVATSLVHTHPSDTWSGTCAPSGHTQVAHADDREPGDSPCSLCAWMQASSHATLSTSVVTVRTVTSEPVLPTTVSPLQPSTALLTNPRGPPAG